MESKNSKSDVPPPRPQAAVAPLRIGIDFGGVLSKLDGSEKDDNGKRGHVNVKVDMPDAVATLKALKAQGHQLFLISHCGKARARETAHGLDEAGCSELFDHQLYFTKSREDKAKVVRYLGCHIMIDDREDVLLTVTQTNPHTVGYRFKPEDGWKGFHASLPTLNVSAKIGPTGTLNPNKTCYPPHPKTKAAEAPKKEKEPVQAESADGPQRAYVALYDETTKENVVVALTAPMEFGVNCRALAVKKGSLVNADKTEEVAIMRVYFTYEFSKQNMRLVSKSVMEGTPMFLLCDAKTGEDRGAIQQFSGGYSEVIFDGKATLLRSPVTHEKVVEAMGGGWNEERAVKTLTVLSTMAKPSAPSAEKEDHGAATPQAVAGKEESVQTNAATAAGEAAANANAQADANSKKS